MEHACELTGEAQFMSRDPVTGQAVNLAMSSYADDVSRKSVQESVPDAVVTTAAVSVLLDEALHEIGVAQNDGKQEHVPFFAGRSANASYRHVFRDSGMLGKVKKSARYLGAVHDHIGAIACEIEKRLAAAARGWHAFGRFWSTPGVSRRAVLIVFTAMVHAPLLSGLEVCRLDTTSLSRLNRCVLKYGRKLMRGKACEKQVLDDGSVKHVAKPNTAVWDFLQLVPADRELRVRRLKWYQTLAKDPIKHSVLLAALFGKLQFEHADTISSGG